MNQITPDLRKQIAERADSICEYCLIHEADTLWGCEVDHVISLKHGGETHADNLAYACAFCNRHKSSDIGSLIPHTDRFCRFFDLRTDQWSDHFILQGNAIEPLTAIGEATARILQFNSPDRLIERQSLAAEGRYPTPPAHQRMSPSS